MKKLHWIVMTVLASMFVAVGCSSSKEPKEEHYGDGGYVKDGKLYVKLYAPEGVKYAPVSEEELPQCIKDMFKSKFELDRAIVFEGEYEGHHAYWMHSFYSSCNIPKIVSIDGSRTDVVEFIPFPEQYSQLTCIYIGEHYSSFIDIVYE